MEGRVCSSRVAGACTPDMVMLWEDMCYLNGPMIGPDALTSSCSLITRS